MTYPPSYSTFSAFLVATEGRKYRIPKKRRLESHQRSHVSTFIDVRRNRIQVTGVAEQAERLQKSFEDDRTSPDGGLPSAVQPYLPEHSPEMEFQQDFDFDNELGEELDTFIQLMLEGEDDQNVPLDVDDMFAYLASEEMGEYYNLLPTSGAENPGVPMLELREGIKGDDRPSTSLPSLDLDVLIITVGSDENLPMPPIGIDGA